MGMIGTKQNHTVTVFWRIHNIFYVRFEIFSKTICSFFIKISHKLTGYHGWDSIFMIIMNSRKKEGGYRIMNNTVCAKLYIPSISRHCYVKFSIFWFVIPIICRHKYIKSRTVGTDCKLKLFLLNLGYSFFHFF